MEGSEADADQFLERNAAVLDAHGILGLSRGDLAGVQVAKLPQRQLGGRERVHAVVKIVRILHPDPGFDGFIVVGAGRRRTHGEAALRRRHLLHIVAQPGELLASGFRHQHERRMNGHAGRPQSAMRPGILGHGRAFLHFAQLLIGRELEAEKCRIEPEFAPGREQFRAAVDGRGARPGEIALLDAAPPNGSGQLHGKVRIDEILVVAKIDMIGAQPADLLRHLVGHPGLVLAAAKLRHDAKGTFHAATEGTPHQRNRREKAVSGPGSLARPDARVAAGVPQIAPRRRQVGHVGKGWPGKDGRGVEPIPREQHALDSLDGIRPGKSLDDGPERQTALAADNCVDGLNVVVVGRNHRMMTADDDQSVRHSAPGFYGERFDGGTFVRVAGEADDIGRQILDLPEKRPDRIAVEPQIENNDAVPPGDSGRNVAQLNGLEHQVAIQRTNGAQPRHRFDQ